MAYLMRIAAYTSHSVNSKIKWTDGETCALQERHDKGTKTAVNMKANVILLGELAQCYNVILIAIWKIDCTSNEHDCVWIARYC
jgi:hypothetical protein